MSASRSWNTWVQRLAALLTGCVNTNELLPLSHFIFNLKSQDCNDQRSEYNNSQTWLIIKIFWRMCEKNYIVSLVQFWRFCPSTCGMWLDISHFSLEDLQVSLKPGQMCCVNARWRVWGPLSASRMYIFISQPCPRPLRHSSVTGITHFPADAISRRAALQWFDVRGGKIYRTVTALCVSRTKERPRVFVHLLGCCLPFSHT